MSHVALKACTECVCVQNTESEFILAFLLNYKNCVCQWGGSVKCLCLW